MSACAFALDEASPKFVTRACSTWSILHRGCRPRRDLEDRLDVAQELSALIPVQPAQVDPAIEHLAAGRLAQTQEESVEESFLPLPLSPTTAVMVGGILDRERKIVERHQEHWFDGRVPLEHFRQVPGFQQRRRSRPPWRGPFLT